MFAELSSPSHVARLWFFPIGRFMLLSWRRLRLVTQTSRVVGSVNHGSI